MSNLCSDNRTREMHKWLGNSVDPSIHYNMARKLRQRDTGDWLLKSAQFCEWKSAAGSNLWLYGKPGSGKTILSSTVIEDVNTNLPKIPSSSLLFFYFRYDFKTTG